jgi:hypothetical protein
MQPPRSTTSTSSMWRTKARTLCTLLVGMVRWSPATVCWLQLWKGALTGSLAVACGCAHAGSFIPLAGHNVWQICMRSPAQRWLSCSWLFLFIPCADLQLMHKIYFGVPIWLVLRIARKVRTPFLSITSPHSHHHPTVHASFADFAHPKWNWTRSSLPRCYTKSVTEPQTENIYNTCTINSLKSAKV